MASEEETKAARERLLTFLPHVKTSVALARQEVPDGRVFFGVMAKSSSGGRVICEFDIAFMKDIETLLGVEVAEPSAMEVDAAAFLSKFGLKRG